MDFNGDYPGSRVKRLKVDTTAEIGGDVTVGGDLKVAGAIEYKEIKTDRVLTLDGKGFAPAHGFQSDDQTGMWRDTNGDLNFSRAGLPVASFRTGQQAVFTDILAFEGDFATKVQAPSLRLTGGLNEITSDTGITVKPGDTDTVYFETTSTRSLPYIQSEDKVQGDFFTFNDDQDNSKVWYDTGDARVKVQVGGDPSCQFYAKTIEGTYAIMDSVTASSLVSTNATITSASCTTLTATTGTVSTLSSVIATTTTLTCVSQPITEFKNIGVTPTQSVPNNNVTIRLVVHPTPSYTRGGSLVTFDPPTGIFTIPSDGYWHVEYQLIWNFSTGGYRQAGLVPYPATNPFRGLDKRLPITSAGEYTINRGDYTAYMQTGDTWQLMILQNSGAAITLPQDPAFPTYVRWTRLY